MKRIFLIVFNCLLIPASSFTQVEKIGLYPIPYPDYHAEFCQVYDISGQLATVYVIHENSPGATASEFKIEFFNGFNMILMEETVIGGRLHIGSALTGIAIAYGGCRETWHKDYPLVILKLVFMGSGASHHCSSFLRVVPDPAANPPGVYATDCAETPNLKPIYGHWLAVSTTGDFCSCDLPVPAEKTTWGQVKALYQ